MSFSEKQLKEQTETYWRGRQSCEHYISTLLGHELAWASENSLLDGTARLRHLDHPVHVLAMTVGETFEPLLQSICVFKPQRLIFILNTDYSHTPGIDHGNALKMYVQQLAHEDSLPRALRPKAFDEADFDFCIVKHDAPTEVFRTLRTAFQREPNRACDDHVNAVDITGAKKSMIAGAFLYAAHSNLPITYVDFERFNPDYGKPYGYLCKIGKIDNPYELFRLRDWERVRQLYSGYNFRGAKELLEGRNGQQGILSAMDQLPDSGIAERLYEPEDVERARQLARLLELYEAWDNGDFAAATRIADGMASVAAGLVPAAVAALGDVWPSAADIGEAGEAAGQLLSQHLILKRGAQKPEDSLFNQPVPLLTYARDELLKIERLITPKEDYRSAFLRAAGLHEWLLKSRLALCWLNNSMELWSGGTHRGLVADLSSDDQRNGFKALVKADNANAMRSALQLKASQQRSKLGLKDSYAVQLTHSAPVLDPYWAGMALDLDARQENGNPLLSQLRNEAIHTHLSIPRPVATAAFDLLTAALNEFQRNWLGHWHPDAGQTVAAKSLNAPAWSEICERIGLAFLPPELRT